MGVSAVPATLAQALAHWARTQPDRVAVRFLEPVDQSIDGASVASLTYAELARRVASIAAELLELADPGERALLLYPPGLDYVSALFGCLHAGLVAVPAYPPAMSRDNARLARLIEDCEPRLALTCSAVAPLCEQAVAGLALADGPVITLATDGISQSREPCAPAALPTTAVAILQYTSGSTGDPRGVMLSHGNLTANLDSAATHFELSHDARGVFWLPPYHDMGLIGGILCAVELGTETTLMSPLAFLSDPLLWLEAVTRYGGTFSAAPNFGFDLCVRRARGERLRGLNLESLRSVVNGAEPVRHATMARFVERFAAVGLRPSALVPSYGLAEATLLVAGERWSEDAPDVEDVHAETTGVAADAHAQRGVPGPVSLGAPAPGTVLAVVDPHTDVRCAEGEVGEIWVQGPSVALGYWNRPLDSEATFRARIAGCSQDGGFLRTGDLGTLRDGRLHVSGRSKDVIIAHGRNHHPPDIEDTAVRVAPGIRPGCVAAFDMWADGEEQELELVLVAEPSTTAVDTAIDSIWVAIRDAIAAEHGLTLSRLALIERGTSLKTSSGKLRRSATRQAYLDGELLVIAARSAGASPTPREGEEQAPRLLRLVLAQTAAVLAPTAGKSVEPWCAFKDMGVDSGKAAVLMTRLSEATGLALPTALVFEHPTPSELAAQVQRIADGAPRNRRAQARAAMDADEPIAIVGMSCRFPGHVQSPRELWELVANGRDAISKFPTDRGWSLDGPDDSYSTAGTSYVHEGGFIDDADRFDADFFRISPREALAMDPQQRLLLEGAWEALESAGIDPHSLRHANVGVFAGIIPSAYGTGCSASKELEGLRITGTTTSVATGRISYVLGLRGAAVSIDTACSSSLVAIHLACDALRAGRCTLALAGGVSVLSSVLPFVEFSQQRALARDGRCKAFAAGADGTNWAEGMGLLVLEPLSAAAGRGHQVLAVVRGSAMNQDGASNGLAAPSGRAQEEVIEQSLADAGLLASDVGAVEAHGTGTALGDPIEARALMGVYGRGSRADAPLWLGSIKSNIGHTGAAAGVAGVIKMVEALRNGLLPRTLHVTEPSPEVDWSDGAVALLTESQPWPRRERPRRAGVSAFGISGTNAHLILEEAPVRGTAPTSADHPQAPTSADHPQAPPSADHPQAPTSRELTCVLSARSGPALRDQAARLLAHLLADPELEPLDVAFSLATGRARLDRRAAVVGAGREALLEGLRVLARGEPGAGVVEGSARGVGSVAFMYSGQGSQWAGMGTELRARFPVFAEQLALCIDALRPHLDYSLGDVLSGEGALALQRVDVVQPALFAVMVALGALWRSFGVTPAAVVGHSQGEIAAAHAAGCLSLEDAARVVATRSRAIAEELAGLGGMASVACSPEQVAPFLEGCGELSLAAVNGPRSLVLSGGVQAVEELLDFCQRHDLRAARLAVDYASHSGQIERIRGRLGTELSGIRPRSGEIPFYSAVTGGRVEGARLDGAYWYRNLRELVNFEAAVRALLADSHSTLVEVSPHPVSRVGVEQIIEASPESEDATVLLLDSLHRGKPEVERYLSALSKAYVRGVNVDWGPLFRGSPAKRVTLPTYAFQRRRFWLEPATSASSVRAAGLSAIGHPLLSARVPQAQDGGWICTGRISLATSAWLADHQLLDRVLLPASAFVELALTAAAGADPILLEELHLEVPLVLDEAVDTEVQAVVCDVGADGRRTFRIYARSAEDQLDGCSGAAWTCHCTGVLGQGPPPVQETARFAGHGWPPRDAEELDVGSLYDELAAVGYRYGPSLRLVSRAFGRPGEVLVELDLHEEQAAEAPRFMIHPALLDGALHGLALLRPERRRVAGELTVPVSLGGVRLSQTGAGSLRVRLRAGADGFSLDASDPNGKPVLAIDSLRTRPIDPTALRTAAPSASRMLFRPRWSELRVAPDASARLRRIAVVGNLPLEGRGIAIEHHARPDALYGDPVPESSAPDLLAVSVDFMRELPPRPQPASTTADGAQPASTTVDGARPGGAALAEAIRSATADVLELLQRRIASQSHTQCPLALITRSAVSVAENEAANLAQAALLGLTRTAQAEHPGSFRLIDLDGSAASQEALIAALASEEPEIAIREGSLLVPRLARLQRRRERPQTGNEGDGTVLITGGTGGLGAVLARHLAGAGGVRRLCLVSRAGPDAPGARKLAGELAGLGCAFQVLACDVTERSQLESLIESLAGEHPLAAVIHAAGSLDDGVLSSLDAGRVARAMAAKVDGAIHLHELTMRLELREFVLISSASATIGSAGQGAYAAANAFVDALAHHRRASGLPGLAIAFGEWQRATGMTHALSRAQRARLARLGMSALCDAEGLELFDAARELREPQLLAMRLDRAALRSQAEAGLLPWVLRELVEVPAKGYAQLSGSLARKLAGTTAAARGRIALKEVMEHLATVLGSGPTDTVDPQRSFKDAGLDSLGAIELRNALSIVIAQSLPSTMVYDHPTPLALAEQVCRLVADHGGEQRVADVKLREAIDSIPMDRLRQAGLLDQLLALAVGRDSDFNTDPPDIGLIDGLDVEELVSRALEMSESERQGQ
jgi:acyl transferase domain-containing protein/acyl-CoA synthetase (AMP-forming)/AMP-acid ligase II/NAD(P)-dependent dehydrogenase (short-subunit alcohol dehydrogenase family)/acyl carrier protein